MNILNRFERFFTKKCGCWIWTGSKNWAGYGQFNNCKFSKRAHRASFELYICEIPKDLKVLHTCDNPACVNPEHLWLGTQADNAEDRESKGRGHNRAGTAHGCSKLTESDIRQIRKDRRTTKQIADTYGTHRGHISDIKNYKLWNHIPASKYDESPRGKGKRTDLMVH